MKKAWWIILIGLLIAGSIVAIKSISPTEITPQKAIEIVKKELDAKSIETITNFDNPEVEEIVFNKQPSIYLFEDDFYVIDKELYKVTFNTTMDGLLGPIAIYVDKASGALVGADFRE